MPVSPLGHVKIGAGGRNNRCGSCQCGLFADIVCPYQYCAVCGFCTAAAGRTKQAETGDGSRRVNAATLVLAIELANEDFQKLAPKGAAN